MRAAWCSVNRSRSLLRLCGLLPVRRYVPPFEFAELGRKAKALGFRTVYAGPLVRSSFNAHEVSELEGIAIA